MKNDNDKNELVNLARLLLEALRDMVSDRDRLSEATVMFARNAIDSAEKSGLLE